ncbi:effector-associated constant component EACC1 [Streptomyces sp. NPDC004059]
MENQLLIRLSEEGADDERVEQLTGYLREELLALDVEDVRPVPAGEIPPGARVVDVALAGTLMVSLGKSLAGLGQVMSVLRDWLGKRHTARPSVTLTVDGDTVELSSATDEQVNQLLRIFVEKHSAVETRP